MTRSIPPTRATIRDVADAAGISHATVSRYLNKHSYVSAQAGEAIERAIVEVRYVPNRTARSLVSRRTMSIAFIVREHSDLFFQDPNLSSQAVGANATLSAAGYQMLILIVEGDVSAQRATELVAGGSVDGAILVAMVENDPIVTALASAGTALVTASTPVSGSSVPSIDTDNPGGTAEITAKLVGTGRRVIAEITGPTPAPVTALRHAGFVDGVGDLYRADLVVAASEWTMAAGAGAMTELLQREPLIDGVVCASDAIAAGAIDALYAAGRSIPGDVGIVGFDDSSWAIRTTPPLSTVRQDARSTGVRMADILLRQLAGEDLAGYTEVIPTTLVWRDSAGPSMP